MPPTEPKQIDYTDSDAERVIDELKSSDTDQALHLLVLTGADQKGKQRFLERLSSSFGKVITRFDLREIISPDLHETKSNIDHLLANTQREKTRENGRLIYFSHGDQLSANVGFTNSKVRYLTPHERYFLTKCKETGNIILIDIPDKEMISITLGRIVFKQIYFRRPDSWMKRFTGR